MIKPIVTDRAQLSCMCTPVESIEESFEVVKDLKDTFNSLERCAGLAAPQIGHRACVICVFVQGKRTIMINPRIIEKKGKLVLGREGCFSVPITMEKPVMLRRFNKIQVTYVDEAGKTQVKRYKAFEARLLQHEIDHLDGILIA